MRFQVRGRVLAGQVALDVAISDLEVIDGPSGPMLVSVSGPEGGLASFSLSEGGLPRVQDRTFFAGSQITGAGHDLIVSPGGGPAEIMVTGIETDGLACYDLGGGGRFGAPAAMQGASLGAVPGVAAVTQGGLIVLADPARSGFWVYEEGTNGRLVSGTRVADTAQTHADAVGAMAALRVDGTDILVIASTSECGVTAYALGGAAPVPGGSVGPAGGLGIMVPSDIAVATTAESAYVIVASAAANGASGALSVMAVDGQGGLRPTDHVLDTRESRFGDVTHVRTVTHDGHTYVVAAGGDGGVTLLELMPGGRLVHLDSIAGTAGAGLDDVTALGIAVIGQRLQVFVATEGAAGILVLGVDLAGRGAALAAAPGGETLTGTAGDDILMDGSGTDRLVGGAGADRYVLVGDGRTDTIAGFDPGEDILDLSGLPFLYDVNALEIVATPTGAVITHRDETIVLLGAAGGPLDVDAVRAAVEIAINHGVIAPPALPPGGDTGTENADRLVGNAGADTLLGLGGNDTLDGDRGHDLLDGGEGDDELYGGAGYDTLRGGAGHDILSAGPGNDLLEGGTGNDDLTGGDGDDTLGGGEGNDTLSGDAGDDDLEGGGGHDALGGGDGDDTLRGGSGNDTLAGEWGDDLLEGGAGNDDLNGGRGDDTLRGDDGDDSLYGAGGADLLQGGAGHDLLFGQGEDDTVEGGDGNDTLAGDLGNDLLDGGTGDDSLAGGDGDDTLLGGDGADTLAGEWGDDLLEGGAGNDDLNGGRGDDTLRGGEGDDSLYGAGGADLLQGGDGDDLLFGQGENDTLDGGAGHDTLRGDLGDDDLDGGAGDDLLFGDDGRDTLAGGTGNDSLEGGAGDDRLYGGDGLDTLHGGSGDDLLEGGEEADSLHGDDGADTVSGEAGDDLLMGGAGDDSILGGEGGDRLLGEDGNDTLWGNSGADWIEGGAGADVLDGGAGADTLLGGAGNDAITAGPGNDWLTGGPGADTLTGGDGRDNFVFLAGDGRDHYTHFDTAIDRILIDPDWIIPGASFRDYVDAYIRLTDDGAIIDFGHGDVIVIDDLTLSGNPASAFGVFW